MEFRFVKTPVAGDRQCDMLSGDRQCDMLSLCSSCTVQRS
jgi:hypothetical protein